jgi:hypothetical protein
VSNNPIDSNSQGSPGKSELDEQPDHPDGVAEYAEKSKTSAGATMASAQDTNEISSSEAVLDTVPWATRMQLQRYSMERELSYYRERRAYRLWIMLFTAAALLIACIGTTFGLFLILSNTDRHPLEGSLIIGVSWLLAILVVVGGSLFRATRRPPEISMPEIPGAPHEDPAADERVSVLESLRKYQEQSQRQANSSYRLAQFAIFGGFLLLLAGGAVAVNISVTTAQFVIGGLAALGTAISGYIGATAIRMYNRTQAQMNFYYAQPLVQYYLIRAERMTSKLSDPSRADKAMQQVLTETLNIASMAGTLITRSGETPTVKRRRSNNRRNTDVPIPDE